jgi:hypothetical protein
MRQIRHFLGPLKALEMTVCDEIDLRTDEFRLQVDREDMLIFLSFTTPYLGRVFMIK